MSPEVSYIRELADKQQSYRPNSATAKQLVNKDLIMIVAPSGMGKSTLMKKVIETDPQFARVHNNTSRPPRATDEFDRYDYVPHTKEGLASILDEISHGGIVQYAIFPTTGHIYFTRAEDYPATYNLLDTQSQVVTSLRELPFHTTYTVGLVTDPTAWKEWLLQRYQPGDPELLKRMKEAVASLEWLLDQPDGTIQWVYNHPKDISKSANDLISFVKTGSTSRTTLKDFARQLLSLAHQMKE